MPEGPEVKTYWDTIKFIKGKKLVGIKQLDENDRYRVVVDLPVRVVDGGTHGKTMWWKLENGKSIVIVHGMTGHWGLDEKEKFNRMEFSFEGGKKVYFSDMRKFGRVRVVEDLEKELEELGPAVLDKPSYEEFYGRFVATKMEIAKLLLDQHYLAGIGNYLRAEILWEARLSPYRKFNTLTEEEKKVLYKKALEVCDYHYRHPFDFNFKVYEQERDPLGNVVSHDKMAGRTIHWVPAVQH